MYHYYYLTLSKRENLLFSRTNFILLLKLRRPSVVIVNNSWELRRNTVNGKHLPVTAQKQYVRRRKACKSYNRLENAELFASVKDLFLIHHWSPEEIAGRLQLEHQKPILSYATIYRAIYVGMFDEMPPSHGACGSVRYLRHHGKSWYTRQYTERRGSIPISHDISERPAGAAARSQRCHWECDTVAGKTAQAVSTILLQALQEQSVKSLTPDRRKDSPIMPLSRRPWTVCRFISRRRISHGSREATKIPIAYSGSIFPKEWTSRHLQKPMCKLFLQN